nr:hypothetical protein Iba_chr13fCG4990 [Ipomoea batatas]
MNLSRQSESTRATNRADDHLALSPLFALQFLWGKRLIAASTNDDLTIKSLRALPTPEIPFFVPQHNSSLHIHILVEF